MSYVIDYNLRQELMNGCVRTYHSTRMIKNLGIAYLN
jgi:hypothetical protein